EALVSSRRACPCRGMVYERKCPGTSYRQPHLRAVAGSAHWKARGVAVVVHLGSPSSHYFGSGCVLGASGNAKRCSLAVEWGKRLAVSKAGAGVIGRDPSGQKRIDRGPGQLEDMDRSSGVLRPAN